MVRPIDREGRRRKKALRREWDRLRRGVTAEDVARRAGVVRGTVGAILDPGRANQPSPELLRAVAALLRAYGRRLLAAADRLNAMSSG